MASSFQRAGAFLAPGDRSPETEREGRGPNLVFFLRRKEVIHPLVLEGIPCFDLTPITGPALDAALPCGLGKRFRALPALMV